MATFLIPLELSKTVFTSCQLISAQREMPGAAGESWALARDSASSSAQVFSNKSQASTRSLGKLI